MRTKHEATAKTNATGWYWLTARQLHAGIIEFLTKHLAKPLTAPRPRHIAIVTVKAS